MSRLCSLSACKSTPAKKNDQYVEGSGEPTTRGVVVELQMPVAHKRMRNISSNDARYAAASGEFSAGAHGAACLSRRASNGPALTSNTAVPRSSAKKRSEERRVGKECRSRWS